MPETDPYKTRSCAQKVDVNLISCNQIYSALEIKRNELISLPH